MSAADHATAYATVEVTLVVSCESVWGSDCTTGQCLRQATAEARGVVERMIADGGRGRVVLASMPRASVTLREGK